MRTKLLLAVLFIFSGQVFPQVTEVWVQRYNSPLNENDGAQAVAVDSWDDVYVTGWAYNSGTGYDFTTIKYNPSGSQQWIKSYNGNGNDVDYPESIALDGNNNIYISGWSFGSGTDYDFALVKYSPVGIQLWAQRYNYPANGNDRALSLYCDAAGTAYVAGFCAANMNDFCVLKSSSSGLIQWIQTYNAVGSGDDKAESIAVDAAGNTYVTGYGKGPGSDYDYITMKLNPLGLIQWIQLYNGPGNGIDQAYSVALDPASNVYVTGISSNDIATIKYNSFGALQWVHRYNGVGNGGDAGYAIMFVSPDNIYVTGYSTGLGTSDDITTIKINSSGVFQWFKTYNGAGNGNDRASSIAKDNQGNVYVSGFTTGLGTGYDFAAIKYSPAGNEVWVQTYNGPGNGSDVINSVAVDGQMNVYVTGYSYGTGTRYDFATIKYSQVTGIHPVSGGIPDVFKLFQNYPNPFNPVTAIRFGIPFAAPGLSGGFTSLKVYDILGNEVEVLINEQLKPGFYEVEWNAADVSSGVYFYRLAAEGFTETRKMTVVK